MWEHTAILVPAEHVLYMHPAGEKLKGDATVNNKNLEGEPGMGRSYDEVYYDLRGHIKVTTCTLKPTYSCTGCMINIVRSVQ